MLKNNSGGYVLVRKFSFAPVELNLNSASHIAIQYMSVHLISVIHINIIIDVSYSDVLKRYLLGVASKQLRLLHGRVEDSTIVVNSLSPQMSELVEDAIAS